LDGFAYQGRNPAGNHEEIFRAKAETLLPAGGEQPILLLMRLGMALK
jgi:hypothetical protein